MGKLRGVKIADKEGTGKQGTQNKTVEDNAKYDATKEDSEENHVNN